MITKKEVGLIISLSGFSVTINTLPSLVTSFSDTLGIPYSRFSLVFVFQYASFALFSSLAGKLSSSRHINLPIILIISLAIASISVGFIGFSWSFIALVVFMVIIGGTGGSVESIGTALLAHESNNTHFMYFSQFFYAVGAFSAPLLISIMLSNNASMLLITLIISLFSIAITVVVALLICSKRDTSDTIETAINRSPTIPEENVLKHRGVFFGLFLAMVMYVIIESSLASWLPSYFESSKSFDSSTSSSMLTSFWAGLVVTRLWYSFHQKKGTFMYLILHSLIMCIFIALLSILKDQDSYFLLLGSCFLVGIGCGPIWPLLIEYCMKMFHKKNYTMYLIAGGSLGALSGPLVTALIFSTFGIDSFFFIMGCYTLILLVSVLRSQPRIHVRH